MLNSPDREQRRQAIVALANSRDPAALKPLAAVYRFGGWLSCGALFLSGLLLAGMWCLGQALLTAGVGALAGTA